MDLTSYEVYNFFLIVVTNCVTITGVVFELNFIHASPIDICRTIQNLKVTNNYNTKIKSKVFSLILQSKKHY